VQQTLRRGDRASGRYDPRGNRVAELGRVPHHDIEMAPGPPGASRPVTGDARLSSRGDFYLRLGLSLVLGAVVGVVILVFWAVRISDPCPCRGDFCILGNPSTGGADAHLGGGGAVLGVLCGGIGLLIVSGYLVSHFRIRLRHPFLSLVVGFPLLYIAMLAAIWAVARVVWGPTKC
jgi:hypothetical protein